MISNKNNGFGYSIYFQIPRLKNPVPIFIIFRAFNIITDKEKEIVLSYEDRVKSSNYKEVSKLSKSEQEDILKKSGYSDEAIKSLKTERDRVSVIIKSNKKKYPGNELIGYDQYDKERKALIDQYRKSTNVDELKELNKSEQVQILKDMGYSDQAIRSLKTEADRVKVIARRNK